MTSFSSRHWLGARDYKAKCRFVVGFCCSDLFWWWMFINYGVLPDQIRLIFFWSCLSKRSLNGFVCHSLMDARIVSLLSSSSYVKWGNRVRRKSCESLRAQEKRWKSVDFICMPTRALAPTYRSCLTSQKWSQPVEVLSDLIVKLCFIIRQANSYWKARVQSKRNAVVRPGGRLSFSYKNRQTTCARERDIFRIVFCCLQVINRRDSFPWLSARLHKLPRAR